MEYTPSSLYSQLNPCDFNHSDLPYIRPTKLNTGHVALKKMKKLKLIRKSLEAGSTLGNAVFNSGVKSSKTIYNWINSYYNSQRLRNYIDAAQERGQQVRNDIVEDAQFKRLADGKASGSEYEFYLTNRRPDRWKKALEFAAPSGAPPIRVAPVINYISVHAVETTVKVGDNGGGNGNGKEHARIADHA